MAGLDCMNVYADGTACFSPVSPNQDLGLPSEFTEEENEASFHQYLCDNASPVQVPQTPLRLPLRVNDVYADGTACAGSGSKNVDSSNPSEFMESEREACFHAYLSDIAPPEVVVMRMSPGVLEVNDVYADGTVCMGGSPKNIDIDIPCEFDEMEKEACLHEYLSTIAPVVVSRMDTSNVYADGTACLCSSPMNSDPLLPCEFVESEREASFHEYLSDIAPPVVPQRSPMPLNIINVYTDGTACTDSSFNNSDSCIPGEFDEPEKEASFHEYLSDIAPPVVVPQEPLEPLDVNNVYADGTACVNSSDRNIDSSLPREFMEPEKEASLHEYLCDIAPLVPMTEPCSPKVLTSTHGRFTPDNIMEESPPDQLLGA
eukprot:gnl/MRDRNA2_/MRDRNA2_117362_c0_seq1.p1 gnl/MRDRNA2_/MRDRNA2_117362_c0~~gnl/MRDRNA2_/MRDRNA2_117362_c0_seq1.p1  ORF type:complete len:373 (+),score=92.89 gnl/MRDRNA2_/MRDRNA2_117362_c0_seq1:100-1218(+)